MNLNPVEWSQAQDLLVKLVQVLTPLTERIVPASFFLSRRFVVPNGIMQEDGSSIQFRHPVRILTDLQKQVDEWIAKAPQEQAAANRSSSRNESVPRNPLPLSKQAQKLIVQVQDAIGKLASSANIQDPQEAPLREALKKLKPNLDRIIDSMAHDKEPQPAPPSTFRHPVPRSPREYLFEKPHAFSETAPKEKALEAQREVAPSKDPATLPKTREGSRIEPSQQAVEASQGAPLSSNTLKKKESSKENLKIKIDLEKGGSKDSVTEVKITPKSFEAIALPGAPFISQAKNLVAPRKKKKRKGFWFKGEEDPEDRSSDS